MSGKPLERFTVGAPTAANMMVPDSRYSYSGIYLRQTSNDVWVDD